MASKKQSSPTVMPAADPRFVFVCVQTLGNLRIWICTDASVAIASCPLCAAVVGEACRARNGGVQAGTHLRRRERAAALRQRLRPTRAPLRDPLSVTISVDAHARVCSQIWVGFTNGQSH